MATKQPATGDAVLFDGQMHLIMGTFKKYSNSEERLVTLVIFENAERKVTGLYDDLRWDADLGHWYMWGRNLAKSDRVLVAHLRDRGLLPARKTRQIGSAPAGGEHKNLHTALFHGRAKGFWEAEVDTIRAGGDLSEEAVAAIADYKVLYAQPLVDGYADPGDNDSEGATS